jgi:hypothetical protein
MKAEIIKFKDIVTKVEGIENLWLTAERKWTLTLNREILAWEKAANNSEKYEGNTGIFLKEAIDFIAAPDNFKDCLRLVFFNNDTQLQFIALDKSGEEFFFHKSDIVNKPHKFRNVYYREKISNKDNYRFKFAQSLGAANCLNKDNQIQVVFDDKKWRLSHE